MNSLLSQKNIVIIKDKEWLSIDIIESILTLFSNAKRLFLYPEFDSDALFSNDAEYSIKTLHHLHKVIEVLGGKDGVLSFTDITVLIFYNRILSYDSYYTLKYCSSNSIPVILITTDTTGDLSIHHIANSNDSTMDEAFDIISTIPFNINNYAHTDELSTQLSKLTIIEEKVRQLIHLDTVPVKVQEDLLYSFVGRETVKDEKSEETDDNNTLLNNVRSLNREESGIANLMKKHNYIEKKREEKKKQKENYDLINPKIKKNLLKLSKA